MSNLYRGPPIDASYQVSVYLATRFHRRRFFRNRPIRNKNCLWPQAMLFNGSGRNEHSLQMTFHRCFLLSFGSFGQTLSEQKNFKNQLIINNNRLWRPCFLTDRDEMSNIYRAPSKDASYQVSVHLAKRFQRRRCFRNQPIRNKNCLWWPCLLTNRDEMSKLYRCFLPSFGSFGLAVSEEKI